MLKHKHDQTKLVFLPVAVVLVTAAMAAHGQLIGWEAWLFRLVNNLPDAQRLFWLIVTGSGSVFCLLMTCLGLLLFRYYRLALRLFGVGAMTLVLSELLKFVVDRPRPVELLSDVHVRQTMIGNGYPSSHTALATAMCIVLIVRLAPTYRYIGYGVVVLVALSRLYLGVHAPLDVVGGAGLGAFVALVILALHGKLRTVTKITGLRLAKQKGKA